MRGQNQQVNAPKNHFALRTPSLSLRESVLQGIKNMNLPEAYEVGGSIRDELMGREPKDIDICVGQISATELLEKARQEGKAEELVVADRLIGVRLHAPWAREGVELALLREEVSTGPGHTDFEIRCSEKTTLQEDLKRRDFTCNAIARDLDGNLHDPYEGQKDIEEGILRMVSERAFEEDPLRVLRGLRRLACDGSSLEANTAKKMQEVKTRLQPDAPGALSGERVYEELNKILKAPHGARALTEAKELGILEEILPEWAPVINYDQDSSYHALKCDEHILLAVERAEQFNASQAVRWAAFLHDAGKPRSAFRGKDGKLHYYDNKEDESQKAHELIGEEISEKVLNRLHASKDLEKKVSLLVREHMYQDDADFDKKSERKQRYKARKFIQRIGRDNVEELMMLRRCDRAAKKRDLEKDWDTKLNYFEKIVKEEMNSPLTVKELNISGHDLMQEKYLVDDEEVEMNLRGPQIGRVLQELLQRVVTNPEDNNKERLLKWSLKLAEEERK